LLAALEGFELLWWNFAGHLLGFIGGTILDVDGTRIGINPNRPAARCRLRLGFWRFGTEGVERRRRIDRPHDWRRWAVLRVWLDAI
jgi:hypothetical protein